jgi:hypothetical protein
MSNSERQEDGARAGTGTVVKTGRRPVQDREPDAVVPPPAPRRGRQARPAPPRQARSSEAQSREAQTREAESREAESREAESREAQTRQAQTRQAQTRQGQPRPAQPQLARPRPAGARPLPARPAQPPLVKSPLGPAALDPSRKAASKQAPSKQAPSTLAPSKQAPSTLAPSKQAPSKQVPPQEVRSRLSGPQPAVAGRAGQRVAPPARTRPGAAPWRVPPAERGTGPQPVLPSQAPVLPAQPGEPAAQPDAAPVKQTAVSGQGALDGTHRMPFVLLLCGLLGGALVCALVISTTLAEGTFQISKLQDSTSALARQQQVLQEQVAQAQSPQVIEQRASKLGMRMQQELLFVDLKSGKTTNDGPTWSGAVNAPGYAP